MGDLKITLKRSTIGANDNHKKIVKALGLGRINSTVVKPDNPSIRGMVEKISHMVETEEI